MKKRFLTLLLSVISIMAFAQFQTTPEWTSILSNQPETFRIQLISSSEESVKVNVQVPGFYTTTVTTPRGDAKIVSMPKAISTAKAGEPNVPMTGIPAIINDRARMDIRVVDAQYMDFENIEVAPSKGDFPRTIDPATVPYTYGECYSQNAFFPASNVGLYEPYIVRDFRGQNMVVYPYAYNPVAKTLRVYYNMTVEMYKVDDNGANVLEGRKSNTVKMNQDFKSFYQRHFINYEASMAKYTPLEEEGDLLIICYDNFISYMTDFVNWKKTRGINTTIVGTNTTGNTASAIKTYITNQYNANNNLTHVLLVGDVAQIPGNQFSAYVSSQNDYSGYGDNLYGQIAGSDIYNDLIIGRFSASTAARVTTQATRAITYERDLTTSASWLQVGEGISRKEDGSGHNNEDDYQHMDNIRTDLLNYGYTTVNQRYANLTGYDGSSATISSDINSGVGIINYANHGQETAWGANTSGYIYYSNSHVNALTNENKLPFIFSVACLVGKYDHSSDCFAEAWMNATNNNNPTGAVGTLMSYISQPWIPPMWAQDECIDILVGNSSTSTSQKYTFGGVCINGLMGIFDHYSTSDKASIGTYQAWIVYGDPTLMVRTKTPQAMTVSHAGNITLGASSYTVNVSNGNGAVATITDANHNILGKATVSNGTATINISGEMTPNTELTLCVFGYNKVTYLGTISVMGGTQYNISVTQPQHGTISAPALAYASSTVTLTATPETGYCLSSWTVTAGSQNITVTNNQFTMPESDVTVTATFVQGMAVTLASVTNGSISADPLYALQGNTVTLTATPATGYNFDRWVVYKTGDVSTTVTVNGNSFTMPGYPVTISAIFLAPTGGETTIGSGTGTTSGSDLPTDVYYKYCLSQQIYTAAEVGDAGTITAISFYYNSSTASGNRSLDIYMSHTSSSTITSWVTESSDHLVYSGSHNFTEGWNTITLTTPFTYNGTSNLLLTVDDNTGSYYSISQFIYFYTYSTGENRAIYYRNDNNNPSATSSNSYTATKVQYNAQMKVTKEVPSNEGYLSVSPTSLSGFEATAASAASASKSVAVIGANLQDNVTVTLPNGYEVSSNGSTYASTLTLTPSNGSLQQMLYVRLAASLNQGNYTGGMTIASGTTSAIVSLSGVVNPDTGTVTQHTITATANPTAGGTISGTGSYDHGATATLTATANEGYTFTNWTKDNISVSTNATYSFTVTEATTLVANFTINTYNVTATANPTEGGTITVGSSKGNRDDLFYDFENGWQNWTTFQGSTTSPNSWMHNTEYVGYTTQGQIDLSTEGNNSSTGFMLSESYISATTSGGTAYGAVTPDNYLVSPQFRLGGSIKFYAAARMSNYPAEKFSVMVSESGNTNASDFTHTLLTVTLSSSTYSWNEYTVDLSAYSGMGYVAIRHFDCNDQHLLYIDDVTIVEGVAQSTGSGNFNYGETCVVTATPNTNYYFLNWTEGGTIVSSNAAYSFTVTGDRDLVANFTDNNQTVSQTSQFSTGWNWWTPNVDLDGVALLNQLKEGLGTHGIRIAAQNGDALTYSTTYGWTGNLTSLEVGKMYKIQTNADCNFSISGPAVTVQNHSIELYPGLNWIGFFGSTSMNLSTALQSITPTAGDIIASDTESATYSTTYGWYGTLQTLEPGRSYTYKSNATSISTLTFPSNK